MAGGSFLANTGQSLQKRQTAYKKRIVDILNAKYIKTEGLGRNYIEINGQEISRVSLIATVVDKLEFANYKSVIIDDGSGKIPAMVFEDIGLLGNINIGSVVSVIGRPREFSSEKYILIEIIKTIDSRWAKIRNLEMESLGHKESIDSEAKASLQQESCIEEPYGAAPATQILNLIKELDKGDGADIEEICSKSIKDADKIIDVLLREGNIFEIKHGKLKLLE